VPNIGAILRLALLAFFALLVIVSGLKNGFHGSLTSGFFPTNFTVFIGVLGSALTIRRSDEPALIQPE